MPLWSSCCRAVGPPADLLDDADAEAMRTATLGVSSLEEILQRVEAAFRGEEQGASINFASVDLLWKVITPQRWRLIEAMAGHEPMTIRAVARPTGHDVKAVHRDVQALLTAGVLDRTEDGKIVFPYDAVRVAFELKAA